MPEDGWGAHTSLKAVIGVKVFSFPKIYHEGRIHRPDLLPQKRMPTAVTYAFIKEFGGHGSQGRASLHAGLHSSPLQRQLIAEINYCLFSWPGRPWGVVCLVLIGGRPEQIGGKPTLSWPERPRRDPMPRELQSCGFFGTTLQSVRELIFQQETRLRRAAALNSRRAIPGSNWI